MIFLVISLLDDKPPASNDNPERGPYPTPIQMSKHKPNHRMTTIHPLTPESESTSSPLARANISTFTLILLPHFYCF